MKIKHADLQIAKPRALLLSDLHLSDKAPIFRSAEPDWFAAQKRVLIQIRRFAREHAVPVIIAGDLFHKWNSSAALINLALEFMPKCYAIPGQHDLPFHSLDNIEQSAYWTLVKAGRVEHLYPGTCTLLENEKLALHSFPWGVDVTERAATCASKEFLHVAVVHAYIWKHGAGYVGAPENSNIAKFRRRLTDYHVAVFGDNHIPFEGPLGRCFVWNNGSVQRRNSDELEHKPRCGLLLSDGTVTPYHLNTEADKTCKVERDGKVVEEVGFTMQEFLKELKQFGANPLDFRAAVLRYFDQYEVSEAAQKVILSSLE